MRYIKNKLTLFLLFLGLSLGNATPVLAQTPTTTPLIYSTTTAPVIIAQYASKYGISAQPLINTLACESSFDSGAIGDNGASYGVSQIYLPAHPEISKTEALDPLWSINWAAQEFAAGNAHLWTCYRKMQKGTTF